MLVALLAPDGTIFKEREQKTTSQGKNELAIRENEFKN
jgi:hypothetical protein